VLTVRISRSADCSNEGEVRGVAAARSSRKYYLDRVLTVLLSFTLTNNHTMSEVVLWSQICARSVAAQRLPSLCLGTAVTRAASARDLKYEPEDLTVELRLLSDEC
jgi:hypothetical protein